MKNLLTVREATEEDIDAIFRLLEIYASRGIVLRRSRDMHLSQQLPLRPVVAAQPPASEQRHDIPAFIRGGTELDNPQPPERQIPLSGGEGLH